MLSDQLKNVGAPVSNNRLVLQMVAGLTDAYNGVATLLRQSDPLPPFYQARSMLVLEEAGLNKKVVNSSSSSALVAGISENLQPDTSSSHRGSYHSKTINKNKQSGGRNSSQRGGGNNRQSSGGGGGRSGGQQSSPAAPTA